MRSGDCERRNKGDPGSALFGRGTDFFAGDVNADTKLLVVAVSAIDSLAAVAVDVERLFCRMNACVVCELPTVCPELVVIVNGLGERAVSSDFPTRGNTFGEGVRARGDNGIWPHDLRRGDRKVCTNLCFRP